MQCVGDAFTTWALVTVQSIEDLEATIENLREKREGIKKEMDEQVTQYHVVQ